MQDYWRKRDPLCALDLPDSIHFSSRENETCSFVNTLGIFSCCLVLISGLVHEERSWNGRLDSTCWEIWYHSSASFGRNAIQVRKNYKNATSRESFSSVLSTVKMTKPLFAQVSQGTLMSRNPVKWFCVGKSLRWFWRWHPKRKHSVFDVLFDTCFFVWLKTVENNPHRIPCIVIFQYC